MPWIIKHVLIHIFLTEWTILSVIGGCVLSGRIKRNDADVMVSQTDQPCTLTLTAKDNKQVVVAMYDTTNDCIEKGTIAFYDGVSTSGALLTNVCQAHPWSFASRNHSLTVSSVPDKPLRPFSLDIHSFDTVKIFTSPTGTITSERYPGSISGSSAMTAPNNFHAFYKIVVEGNVTVKLFFKEFEVQALAGKPCPDFVKIHALEPSSELCGQHIEHPNVTRFTDTLLIEFKTDNYTTYSGFVVEYAVSSGERVGENGTENAGQRNVRNKNNNTPIIIVAALGSVLVIVIVIIAVIVARQRLTRATIRAKRERNNKSRAKQNGKDNDMAKFETNTEDNMEIYVGNEDYDITRINRMHKRRSINIYEGTFESSDEYAVVDRKCGTQTQQPTGARGDHSIENVYN